MRRCFRYLFFAMVLTLAMMMGLSISVKAAGISVPYTNDYDSGIIEYVEGESFEVFSPDLSDSFDADVYLWLDEERDDDILRSFNDTHHVKFDMPASYFPRLETALEKPVKRVIRYRWDSTNGEYNIYFYTEQYYEEHYGSPKKVKPVTVDFHNSIKAGATFNDIKNNEVIDRDTFKSEALAHTVIASETATDAFGLFDLKVHKPDEKSTANQVFLAKTMVGPNVQILLTQNIYPRRDLAIAENGSAKKLTWNNLPKDQAGPVFAIVYNETDGAYVLNGTLDANGIAVFNGFKLRAASTITICK